MEDIMIEKAKHDELIQNELLLFKSLIVLREDSITEFAERYGFNRKLFTGAINRVSKMQPEYSEAIHNYLEAFINDFESALQTHREYLKELPSKQQEQKLIKKLNNTEDEIERIKTYAELRNLRDKRSLGR